MHVDTQISKAGKEGRSNLSRAKSLHSLVSAMGEEWSFSIDCHYN